MDSDGLSPGAVSARLGIAVTTLRTWHQRYGLGPTGHAHGNHRRYSDADLTRLETMRRLTSQGVPAAQAARIALESSPRELVELAGASGRAGGGHAIPVGRARPEARGLAKAASRLDMLEVRELIEHAVAGLGVVDTWTGLLMPVLVGIGKRHAATHQLIDVEHLLSRCVAEVLGGVPRPPASAPNRILLACADEEQHTLALEALAAALAERGIACRFLGARVPPAALLDAVRRSKPAVVVVWSQTALTADSTQLTALAALTPRPALIVAAGPGWVDDLPETIATVNDLPAAVALTSMLANP